MELGSVEVALPVLAEVADIRCFVDDYSQKGWECQCCLVVAIVALLSQ